MKKILSLAIAVAAFGSLTGVRAAETCCAKDKACCVEKKACCAEHAAKPGAANGAKQKSAKPAAQTAKLIEVKVCPMMMHAVEGTGGGSSVVGNHKVHFCCGGCKPAFDKLSSAEKAKKVAEALKKQEAAKAKA